MSGSGWITLALILHPVWAGAAQPPPHWRFWLNEDGLGESCSNAVFVSPAGRVLVNHGHVAWMSLLDGYEVINLPSPGVGVPVYETPSGTIWSIHSGGFQRYEYGNDIRAGRWIPYSVPGIQNSTVPFFPVSKDRVIFLLPDRISRFDAASHQTELLKSAADSNLGAFNDWLVIPAREDLCDIWIGGRNGMAHALLENTGSLLSSWEERLTPESYGLSEISSLTAGDQGEIFATALYSPTQKRVLARFERQICRVLYENPSWDVARGWSGIDEALWIFHSPFTLTYIENQQAVEVEQNKVLSRVLIGMAREAGGAFWLATSEGLARHAPAAWRTPPPAASWNGVIHDIREDTRGRVWFVAAQSLLCLREDQWTEYTFPSGAQSQELLTESLVPLADGRLAVKASNGLLLFDPETARYETARHPEQFDIVLIAANPPDGIWAVTRHDTETRIETYDGARFQTVISSAHPGEIDPNLRHLYADGQGNFWFAGLEGLVRCRGGEFHWFGPDEGYTDTAANCICPLDDHRIWVGGRDAIHEWNGAEWKAIRAGLDGVRSIHQGRDGSLWVASGSGLHRYKDGSWVTLTYEDGLPNAAVFEVYEDRRNRIWAGTTRGISLYHPEADRDPPQTYIPRELNANRMLLGEVKFFFQGVDKWKYIRAGRLLYSWRVDDGPWRPFAPDTVAQVPVAKAGRHRFEARAMDRNWNVDPTPAVYPFTVMLPWYREPVLLALFGLGTVLLGVSLAGHFSYHRNLGRLVAERTQELTLANQHLLQDAKQIKTAYEKVVAYQKQLQSLASELSLAEERERRRLAADLHDTIGQNLALSLIQLEGIQESLAPTAAAGGLETVKGLIDRTLQHSRALTLELCPPILYEVGFEAAMEQLADQIEIQHGVHVECRMDSPLPLLTGDLRYFLYRATRELLLNVVKHARVREAELVIQASPHHLRIEVIDRGIGFAPDIRLSGADGFGLFSIRERLQQIGGEMTIQSQTGTRTRVILEVPWRDASSTRENPNHEDQNHPGR
ncbi:MAG: ATP-binding protein [bacterium]